LIEGSNTFGRTSITVEPAAIRANRINSERVEGFIGISKAAGSWKTLIWSRPRETELRRASARGRFVSGDLAAAPRSPGSDPEVTRTCEYFSQLVQQYSIVVR
jgi:hypothetical protein